MNPEINFQIEPTFQQTLLRNANSDAFDKAVIDALIEDGVSKEAAEKSSFFGRNWHRPK